MTRWVVTGAAGMLGQEVEEVLRRDGAEYLAFTRDECDITVHDDVDRAIHGADVVVNCAAWTDVDGAESSRLQAEEVNGYGALRVANACHRYGAILLHVSTDYAVSGTHGTPIPEDAPTSYVNQYGFSKAVGEEWVRDVLPDTGYIVRTAWLYGEHGPNFVDTMARLARGDAEIRVVDDQFGQPTWARALAARLVNLGYAAVNRTAPAGIYHGTASGQATWYGLACTVFAALGEDTGRVVPVTSAEYPRPAVRPSWSVLGHERWRDAGMHPMEHWVTQLGGAMGSSWFS
jgi:dTDP-4-dehydrorhamnose reductase